MPGDSDAGLIEAIRGFNRFYTGHLGLLGRGYLEAGMTLTEARVLYEIGARGELAASDLTRDLHLDPAYLSRILKKFGHAGLVGSRIDADDRRSRVISLTAAGTAAFESIEALSRRQLAALLAPIEPAGRSEIAHAFASLRRLLDPSAAAGPVVIRPHRPGDLGWMVQSQAEFYTGTFGWDDRFEALVAEVAGAFLRNFNPAREHCWIAERDGIRIGSVLVADGGGDVAKLRLLYIDGSARGLGLGRMLVEQCIAFARQARYRQLTLWTNDILHAARAIYRQQGFRLVSEERHTMFGPDLTGQTWTLEL
ncbi:MarR family transcriptional regulator with acetyltransferase activity [Hoeflea marina]|uniref:MarR family transcriptional regulator with acetyltransferase activity n=1 Tax=Hoeflea marina TaxID=274592 RepID=A0A317PKH8_9HYPH|nr:helix-turn-helix domain-containing GNAT family N-acetyltransferase [Hoeflea marina]PWV99099.1 MarR family transcriptional regulator with acetyltransferase activity [Hoeflea marina]